MSYCEYTPIEVVNRPSSIYLETRIKCPCGKRGFAPLIINQDTIVMCSCLFNPKQDKNSQCTMQRKDNIGLVRQMIKNQGVDSKWGKILTIDANITLVSFIDGKFAPVVAALKFPDADCPFRQYCWNKKPLDLGVTPPPDSFEPRFKDLPEIKPPKPGEESTAETKENSFAEKPAA